MAKRLGVEVQNAALTNISANGNLLVVCSAEPTTYAEGFTTYKLASVALAPADFTQAAGDVSGRKTTVGAKTGIPVATSGTASHLAILDTANSLIKSVTTCTAQAINTGGTVDTPAYKVLEVQNPT